jgi:REP element-mobilizing transposase RayT
MSGGYYRMSRCGDVMPQSFAAMYVHVIFSTKNREPWIEVDLRERLFAYIGGVIGERKSVLLAAGGVADHVHLLISFGREWCVADMVRDVKATSSRWLHETFDRRHFAWQAGYGAFSVSYSGLDAVKRYLARQEEHHKQRTFQDEYREFLRRHNIEFDERYVWD